MKLYGLFFITLVNVFSGFSFQFSGNVIPYPPVQGAVESGLFSVEVNKKKIWTEHYTSNLDFDKLPDWFSAPYVREHQEMHIASFEGDGELEFCIKCAGKPHKVIVKPISKGIIPDITDDEILFSWNGPGQLVVEVDDLPPLYIFINPKEKKNYKRGDENVVYYGPGIHEAGYIELEDNQTVYIAAGAIVYGGIRAKNAKNIKVVGRGILDGDYRFSRMVLIENSSDILFEGVTIRNSESWTNTLVNCRDAEYRNVKVLGFGPSSDGINPTGSQRVKIADCFMRCTDDCIAIKALAPQHPVKDIWVENSTMIGFAYADGVTIGFETNAEFIKDIIVKNCDILLARGGSRVDGHSGFSIICDGPAKISNILFEDIRVEQSDIKLFELHITDGTKYGTGPAGQIRDVTIRNVNWLHEAPIIILGQDSKHKVKNILFENCRVAGKPLDRVKDQVIKLNEFVENISVR